MNYRRKNRLLIVATASLVAATGAVWVGGFLLSVEVRTGRVDTPQLTSTQRNLDPDAGAKQPVLADVYAQLRELAARPLRAPLVEVQAESKEPPNVAAKPSLSVTLIGTAREPGNSMAIFRKRDGTLQWVARGETFETASGNVTLQEVSVTHVTLCVSGREVQLQVPERMDRPPARPRVPFPLRRP